ncbi:MAG: hypothetical protein KDH94_06780, partial [Coxiellaceae bacterium]|nr:hypothetical protein [Coxiellaceae bacterium]
RLSVEKKEADQRVSFEFSYEEGPLVKALRSGKEVILSGPISASLESQLASLALPSPYITVNGQVIPVTGRLTIVSDRPATVTTHVAKSYTTEDFLSSLAGYDFVEGLLERIQKTIAILEARIGQFSYQQLKTIFELAQTYPTKNPFKPLLRMYADAEELIKFAKDAYGTIDKKQEKELFATIDEKRFAKLKAVHTVSRAAFLEGETGAGKTTFIKEVLRPRVDLFVLNMDENPEAILIQWLESQASYGKDSVLFADEVNLMPKAILDVLEALCQDQNSVIIQGKQYPLKPHHRILFAGNASTYQGRKQRLFFNEMPTLHFKAITMSELLERYRVMVFNNEHSTEFSAFSREADRKAQKKQHKNETVTPRDFNRFLLRFLEKQGKVGDLDIVAFKTFLSDNGKPLIITDNWRGPLKKMQRLIANRNYHIASTINVPLDKPGILLEGDSALAKTSFTEALLAFNGIEPVRLSGKNPVELREALIDAFQEGRVVIIDEFNTVSPHIENLLNHLMSGVDLQLNPAGKPGFLVFGSQNSCRSFANRASLSPA